MKRLVPDAAALSGATILAVVAILATGCGGSGNPGTEPASEASSGLVAQPTPKRPIAAEVAGFERALENGSCEEFMPFVFSTIRGRPPGSPATRAECREEPRLAAQYAHRVGPPIARSEEYGTGGLMAAPTRLGNEDYTVWVLDGDGRYRFVEQEGIFHPEIGTPFSDREEAERVAQDFVDAVDEHNCFALLETLHDNSRLVEGQSPKAACRAVLDGAYFAPAVHATPKVEVEALGGTRTFAFIGVPTASAYFTITLGQLNGRRGMRVVDVLPSTPLEPAAN